MKALLAAVLVFMLTGTAAAAEVLRFEGEYQELTFHGGQRTARPMRLEIWDQDPRGVSAGGGKAYIRLSNGEVYPVVSRFVGTRSAVYLGVRAGVSLVVHFGTIPDNGGQGAAVDAQMLTSTGGPPRPLRGTWHPAIRPPTHH